MKESNKLLFQIEEVTKETETSWLTTFADLTMLLLTFFILLYSFSSLNSQKFNSYLSSIKKALIGKAESPTESTIANIKKDVGLLMQEVQLKHQLIETQRKVFSDFNYYLTQKGIEGLVSAKFDNGKIIVDIPSDVLFKKGEIELSNKGKKILKQLRDFFLIHSDEKINIIGHTCDTPPSKNSRFKDNWEISALRALSVLRFINSLGIEYERLTATGLGDTKPIVPNTSEKNRVKNRRVEIILEKEIQ